MALVQIVCAACKFVFTVEQEKTPKQAFCPECGLTCRVPAAAEPADSWHYARDGKKIGPVSFDQLRQMVMKGELQPVDMVLQVGTNKWLPAQEIGQLFFASPTPSAFAADAATGTDTGTMPTPPLAVAPVNGGQPPQRSQAWPKVLIGVGGLSALLAVGGFGAICCLIVIPRLRPTSDSKDVTAGARYVKNIERVLQEDKNTPNGAKSIAEVVTRMRAVNLSGCPNDFKAAYLAHLHAWEMLADVEKEAIIQKARNESAGVLVEACVEQIAVGYGANLPK